MKKKYFKPAYKVVGFVDFDVLSQASTLIDVGGLLGGDAHELWR